MAGKLLARRLLFSESRATAMRCRKQQSLKEETWQLKLR
jgi:hypothetical protein